VSNVYSYIIYFVVIYTYMPSPKVKLYRGYPAVCLVECSDVSSEVHGLCVK
jgi:hypothetical protein